MFFIPGQLIALVTFPGVIVHELAHQLFCRRYLPRHHRKLLLARSFYGIGVAVGLPTLAVALYSSFAP